MLPEIDKFQLERDKLQRKLCMAKLRGQLFLWSMVSPWVLVWIGLMMIVWGVCT